jgi:hypothetical protein
MKRIILIAAIALGACPGVTLAEDIFDGNELLQQCQHNGMWGDGFCTEIAWGMAAALQAPDTHMACMAPNVKSGQLRDVVVKYLRDHPEKRHLGAANLVSLALQGAFPCNNAAADEALKRVLAPHDDEDPPDYLGELAKRSKAPVPSDEDLLKELSGQSKGTKP